MKLNFIALSLCVVMGMAYSTHGAFVASFDTADDGVAFPAPPDDWTLIPTDASSAIVPYEFDLDESSGNPRMDVSISGQVKISGTGTLAGTFYATIATVRFRLTSYAPDDSTVDEYWAFSMASEVTLDGSGGDQVATFNSGPLSHSFNTMAMPGTYSLSWQATQVTLMDSEGFAKDVDLSNSQLNARGAVVPEAEEFALIAGLGLVAFAGWRRVRA